MNDIIHFYRVSNLQVVRDFYEKVLGFSLFKDQTKCLIYDVHGLGKIGFCTHHPKVPNDSTCITFVYQSESEVDAIYHQLQRLKLTTDAPSINPAFNIYHFFIKDPAGLTLEFQTFL